MKGKDGMNDVFLCLGGNLGDRPDNLALCRWQIERKCGTISHVSSVYETEAWGSTSERNYLNQVIRIKTKLTAFQLIGKLLEIEKKIGRKRTDVKNEDRLIDIDILFFNSDVIEEKGLVVPHPRLQLRNFVLKPLMDIAPGLKHPVIGKTVKQMAFACSDPSKVKKYEAVRYICIEGNIGSGKTTLAQSLAKSLKAGFLPEQFEKNDLLPLFYEDRKTFAFPLEYSFLLARFQQITDAFKGEEKIIVSDYSFFKCLWFAAVNLGKRDHTFFRKHFGSLEKQLPDPDLIVYLQTSSKNLRTNIKNRGRNYEQSITAKYLEKVTKQYEKGVKGFKSDRVLKINVNKYDAQLNERLIKKVKDHLVRKKIIIL
jgi:2-amino-4-hydroxy-6-hydroxymethyldihydropteridine diphosphokinase